MEYTQSLLYCKVAECGSFQVIKYVPTTVFVLQCQRIVRQSDNLNLIFSRLLSFVKFFLNHSACKLVNSLYLQ